MTPIPKRQPYRNQKIRDAANGEPCLINGERCRWTTEHTVFVHLDEQFAGKGMRQKADDCAGFFGCDMCHHDYEKKKFDDRDVLRAYYRTIRRLIDKGVLGQ